MQSGCERHVGYHGINEALWLRSKDQEGISWAIFGGGFQVLAFFILGETGVGHIDADEH